ncbi:MAG: hypothetical protein ACHQ9S_19900 [Candidatus Binatia bacterium]
MRRRIVLGITALCGLLAAPRIEAVQLCATAANCAQVSIGSQNNGTAGGSVSIPFSFTQGPSGAGIGETAAIAFTLMMPKGDVTPVALADCTPNGNLPNAVQPQPALAGFNLVVENAFCSPTRTHCLCPTDGVTVPDNFINVVIYGPNPLPTPGPTPVVIPALPSGQLFTVGLKLGATVGGVLPLHVLNQVDDSPSTRPPFTALLSVGDVNAVDQTCGSSIPPCNDPSSSSQVFITQGRVLVPNGCVGNCNFTSGVTVDEILTMVNIALGNTPIASCEAGDANGDGRITVDEILTGVNNALKGCPA